MKQVAAILLMTLSFTMLCSITNAYSHTTEVENGLNYLFVTQQVDGQWGEDNLLADSQMTTASIIETLLALNETDRVEYTDAIFWLNNQSGVTAIELSQKIYCLSESGEAQNLLASYFDPVNIGWGGSSGFSANTLDTVAALRALKQVDYPFSFTQTYGTGSELALPTGVDVQDGFVTTRWNLFSVANTYFNTFQNDDGGWGLVGGDSDVFITANALIGLSNFHIDSFLQNVMKGGIAYLLDHQHLDGGFGTNESTAYETALCVHAMVNYGDEPYNAAEKAKQFLINTQLANGSWDNDPYATSLAIQALSLLKANLTVAASDISLSIPMPGVDDMVDISATIYNSGLESAHNVVIRFFEGNPIAGGIQIGTDQIVGLLAPGESKSVTVTTSFPATGGTTIFVQVDPDNAISETVETGNEAACRIWVATAPDLSVYGEELSPSTYTPLPGETFVLQFAIHNIGETAVDSFSAVLYDGDPDDAGKLLEEINLSGLNGASGKTETISVAMEDSGSHRLYLRLDPDNEIPEISKSNNTASVAVQVGGAQDMVDLTVLESDVMITPQRPVTGEEVNISITIRNQGTETAEGITVDCYDGDPDSGGNHIDRQEVSTLDAMAEESLLVPWTVSSGVHTLYISVDRDNTISESVETNNQALVRIMPDMVDITVSATDLKFIPEYPVAGDTVWLEATIHNRGLVESGSFSLEIFDGDPMDGGTLLDTLAVNSIEGDGKSKMNYGFIAEARTYRFYAVADTEDEIAEFSEGNNTAVRTIIIKGSGETYGPELVPLEFEFSEETATDPQTLETADTVHITFQNKGDEKIDTPFSVRVFEDINQDGFYTEGFDTTLGTAENTQPLWPNGGFGVEVPIQGKVRFLGAPLSVIIDAENLISEQDEENNVLTSGKSCEVRPENPIEAVIEWNFKEGRISTPPLVANIIDSNNDGQIDQEDTPAIAFGYVRTGRVPYVFKALRGDTGEEIFTVTDSVAWKPFVDAGDIDSDGLPEFIINRRARGLLAFEHDGSLKWDNIELVDDWNSIAPYRRTTINETSVPAIADLESDGVPEIIVGGTVVNSDGSIKWVRDGSDYSLGIGSFRGTLSGASIAADIDLDGVQEVIAGNTVYNHDGSVRWCNTSLMVNDGVNAVGNFDEDPYPEIVLVTDAPYLDPSSPFGYISLRVFLLEHDGMIKWGPVSMIDLDLDAQSTGRTGAPVVADFDGDGDSEIGVKGFDFFFILDKNGNLQNKLSIPYVSDGFYAAPTVYDLNGDGRPEVLNNSDKFFRIFDGKDGSLLFKDSFGADFNSYQNVIVADVDGDDQVEAVAVGYGYTNGQDMLRVYGSANNDWVDGRSIWNQPSYHVTNINDDGTIPRHETPSWLTHNAYRCQLPFEEPENPYITPNLTVSYLRMVQNGSDITLTVRVGCGGVAQAPGGVSVRFYEGDSITGTLIGQSFTTRALSPGEYQDVAILLEGAVQGPIHVTAVVDKEDDVLECREDDNETGSDATVESGLPDLKITSEAIFLPAETIVEGTHIPVAATVSNVGAATASDISVSLFNGNPNSGGTQIGEVQSITGIAPGGSETVMFDLGTFGLTGATMLYVSVDPGRAIEEENEENNLAPALLEVTAPSMPDLSITAENILSTPGNPLQGDSVQISATVTNLGTAVGNIPVRIYLDDPNNGGTLISARTIYKSLSNGQTETIEVELDTVLLEGAHSIQVMVDPAGIIAEHNEENNTANIEILIQTADLVTTIISDKATYDSDEDVLISITAMNTAGTGRNLTWNLFIADDARNHIATIVQGAPFTITPDTTTSLFGTWNTSVSLAGDYTATVEFFEDGRMVSQDTAPFLIAPNQVIDASVFADKIAYLPNDTATILGSITSLSRNYIFENLTAHVSIHDPDGDLMVSEDKQIRMLMPESVISFNSVWNVAQSPKGSYTVNLEVLSSDGKVLAAFDSNFEVLGSSDTGSGFTASLTPPPDSVCQGQDVVLHYEITNEGNEDVTGLALQILVVDPESGDLFSTFETSLDLIQDDTAVGEAVISTNDLSDKTYIAILQVRSENMMEPVTLADTTFHVVFCMDANRRFSTKTRLLVWENGRSGGNCDCDEGSGVDTPIELWVNLLDGMGIEYLMVQARDNFEIELRNPYYTDILILGDCHNLTDHFDDEVISKIHAGTGLITALWHPGGTDDALLGMKLKRNSVRVIHTTARNAYSGTALLTTSEWHLNAIEEGATIAVWTNGSYPTMVFDRYGEGKTVYFSFDLGATLNAETETQVSELLTSALGFVHTEEDTLSFMPYRLAPVELGIECRGNAMDIRIEETFPDELRLYDPEAGLWAVQSPWTIDIPMDASEVKTHFYYYLVPDALGAYPIHTEVGVLENNTFIPYHQLNDDVVVQTTVDGSIDALIIALELLDLSGSEQSASNNAVKYLEKVQQRVVQDQQDIDQNIQDILKAIDSVRKIESIDIHEIQLQLDHLMEMMHGFYYHSDLIL